ncbi:MAG: CotH kinase family protein [Oscillospiraceae bacterium]|nr:CotH kinase family protein [Candidatus Ruminococcus equi]
MKRIFRVLSILLVFILLVNMSVIMISAESINLLDDKTKIKPTIYIRDNENRSYRVWAWLTDNSNFFDCTFANRPKSDDKTAEEYGFKAYQSDVYLGNDTMYCIRITKGNTDTNWFNYTYAYGDIWIDIDKDGVPTYYDSNPEVEATVENAFDNGLWVDTNSKLGNLSSLVLWDKKADGEYYFYLPCGCSLTLPLYHTFSTLKIDDREIVSGESFTFSKDGVYTLGGDVTGSLHILQSENTYSMFLSTPRDIPHSPCYDKNNPSSSTTFVLNTKDKLSIKGGNCLTTDEKGEVVVNDAVSKIKGRGNSSWLFSFEDFGKYSFNLTLDSKTKKITGGDIKTKKYAVNACNTDQSFLRNSVMFKLADSIGIKYTPNIRIYNVYNNGVYFGTYMVSEKVDIGSSSLLSDIHSLKDDNEEINPDIEDLGKKTSGTAGMPGYYTYVDSQSPKDITGGYLLEIDMYSRFASEISGFISQRGQAVTIQSPEYSTKEEVEYIKDFFNKIEGIIYSENPDIDELSKYIDLESFAKMFFINELSKDVDSCATSYFMYKDSDTNGDGKLHAAPVWDYDWSCGQTFLSYEVPKDSNSNASCKEPTGWNSRYRLINSNSESGYCNFQAQLCQLDSFWNTVYSVWKKDVFKNAEKVIFDYNKESFETSNSHIAKMYKTYKSSFETNEIKWGFIKNNPTLRFGTNSTGKDVQGTVSYLNKWLFDRVSWIDKNIGPAEIYYGDADGDGVITITDATTIQKFLAQMITDDDTMIEKRGTLGDDTLSVLDATKIQRFLALLPAGEKVNTREYKDKSVKIKA